MNKEKNDLKENTVAIAWNRTIFASNIIRYSSHSQNNTKIIPDTIPCVTITQFIPQKYTKREQQTKHAYNMQLFQENMPSFYISCIFPLKVNNL